MKNLKKLNYIMVCICLILTVSFSAAGRRRTTSTSTPTPAAVQTNTPVPTLPNATSTPTSPSSTATPAIPANQQDITNLTGTVSAQYNDSPAGEDILKLIDNTTSTKYLTFHASGWVQFTGAVAVVTRYTISSANDAEERDPYTWTFQGSNNGSSWTTLDSRSGEDFPNRFQTREFSFSNGASYSYYRLNLTNNSGTILQLSEWEIFGIVNSTATPTPTTPPVQSNLSWPNGQVLPSFASLASTLDVMNLSGVTNEQRVLFTTLKGLVNKVQPRIYTISNDEEGNYNWINSLGLRYTAVSDNWSLITKYRSLISGVVVYDTAVPDTMNLATTIAAIRNGIVCSAGTVGTVTSSPYNLPILVDLRGQFSNKTQVYQNLYTNYWPQVTHKVLMGINPGAVYGNVRDYASAVGTAVVWLDPRVAAEKTLLNQFLAQMPASSGIYMGWWPEEQSGIEAISPYGLSTCASDWSQNLTIFGGMSRTINIKAAPAAPALQNRIYVTLIVSDGDNLQYIEHRFKNLWDSSNRGAVPVSWTLSPAMADTMPAILNYLYSTATNNDCFISGPSGIGYTYPNYWTNQTYLNNYASLTNTYLTRTGFRIITIWNTILGGINQNVGDSFADYAPYLLGTTSMQAGGQITIYRSRMPNQRLNATYCYSQDTIIMEINNAIAGWTNTAPRFVSIQLNPWDCNYQMIVNAVNNFSGNSNMTFIRADNYFRLIRQYYGLPAN